MPGDQLVGATTAGATTAGATTAGAGVTTAGSGAAEGPLAQVWSLQDALMRAAVDWAPRLALGLGVILGGLLASKLLERATRWLLGRLRVDALLERPELEGLRARLGERGLAERGGRLAFWLGVVGTIYALAELVQVQALSAMISWAVGMLPRVAASAMIMGAGLLAGNVIQRVTAGILHKRDDLEAPDAVASAAKVVVLTLAGALAAEQLGLEVGLVRRLLVMTAGAAALGVTLTLALGGRHVAAQMIAGVYIRSTLRDADQIEHPDEGLLTLTHFGPTFAWFDGADGRVMIPYTELAELPVVRITRSAS